MPKRRQFTLIELLVVLAILGILAAILLPAVQKARQAGTGSTVSDDTPATGAADRPRDPGARETAAALRGFAVGVAATLVVGHLLRRARRRRSPTPTDE